MIRPPLRVMRRSGPPRSSLESDTRWAPYSLAHAQKHEPEVHPAGRPVDTEIEGEHNQPDASPKSSPSHSPRAGTAHPLRRDMY